MMIGCLLRNEMVLIQGTYLYGDQVYALRKLCESLQTPTQML
jgi:hypothetical protein